MSWIFVFNLGDLEFMEFSAGAAFGLGTMIYTGLEFGSFFEIPFTSPCHQILRGVNPLLQMIFTFMQMYFIFMNARVSWQVGRFVWVITLNHFCSQLNIHRFKVLARFGLMHIVATNVCVWIRTLVLESLKEITAYHQRRGPEPEDNAILENIRQHSLKNAGMVMGTELGPREDTEWEPISVNMNAQEELSQESSVLSKMVQNTARTLVEATTTARTTTSTSTTTTTTTAAPTTTEEVTSTISTTAANLFERLRDIVVTESSTSSSTAETAEFDSFSTTTTTTTTTSETPAFLDHFVDHVDYMQRNNSLEQSYESLESLFPQAFVAASTAVSSNGTAISCGRVNIMGTIVQDSAPYLYPFIIEYSLIGAAVIYVMWKHIGRYPK